MALMAPETRGMLGRLAGWVLLGGCILLAVMAGAAVVHALPRTMTMSQSCFALTDTMRRMDDYLEIRFVASPPVSLRPYPYYLQWGDGPVERPMWVHPDKGRSFRPMADMAPGAWPIRAVCNPYVGYAMYNDLGWAWVYPHRTTVVVLDASTALGMPQPWEAAAPEAWSPTHTRAAEVRALGRLASLGYVSAVGLADYGRQRDGLQAVSPGPVMTAARDLNVADKDQLAFPVSLVRKFAGRRVLFVTGDVTWASTVRAQLEPKVAEVLFVGAWDSAPDGVTVAADWPDLMEHVRALAQP